MPRTSAGLLPFVREEGATRVWLGHMGDPLWARRPRGWTIVKGEVEPDEDVLEDGIAFAGVAKFPARVKCALLGWKAFQAATSDALGEKE